MQQSLLSFTLFPYTTLFRSGADEDTVDGDLADRRAGLERHVRKRPLRRFALAGAVELLRRGDRKSTRLNSSHRCISYAVFCLKKKTTINTKLSISLEFLSAM